MDPMADRRAHERAIFAPYLEALERIVARDEYDTEIVCPACQKATKLLTMNFATSTVVRECESHHLLISDGANGWQVGS